VAGFPVGGAPIGTLISEFRIITVPPQFLWDREDAKGRFDPTTPPSFEWVANSAILREFINAVPSSFEFAGEGAIIDARVQTQTSLFNFEGVDSQIRITAITASPTFQFVVQDARYKIVTIPPEYSFESVNAIISALLQATPSEYSFESEDAIISATLITIPPEFEWVGQEGNSFAEGAIEVTSFPAVFEWVGEGAIPSYNVLVDDIPNIVVNRSGTTVSIDVLNMGDSPVFIYKGPETKSTFSLLTNTSSFPYVDSIDDQTSPKYKASFGITGNIGGDPVKLEGIKSRTRYSRKDE
jgi:hypothetical protein